MSMWPITPSVQNVEYYTPSIHDVDGQLNEQYEIDFSTSFAKLKKYERMAIELDGQGKNSTDIPLARYNPVSSNEPNEGEATLVLQDDEGVSNHLDYVVNDWGSKGSDLIDESMEQFYHQHNWDAFRGPRGTSPPLAFIKDTELVDVPTISELLSTIDCVTQEKSQEYPPNTLSTSLSSVHTTSDGLYGDLSKLTNDITTSPLNTHFAQLTDQFEASVADHGLRILNRLFRQSYDKLCESSFFAVIPNLVKVLYDFQALISMGLEILSKFLLENCMPVAGVEVYALLHVAYASALYTNPLHVQVVYNELYVDVVRWSLVIEPRDRAVFENIFRLIWGPPTTLAGATPSLVNENNTNGMGHAQTVDLPHDLSANSISKIPWLDPGVCCASPTAFDQEEKVLLNGLQNGILIFMCRQYLNSVYPTPYVLNSA
ncbi:hypothetical protein MMC14_003481 [Varicellaria rhodocarpa]|nr:hypothetical protein [Varicellaria rhodocarpa]